MATTKTKKEIEQFFKAKQEALESLQPRPQMILNDLPLESDLKPHPVFTEYASTKEGDVYSFKSGKIKLLAKVNHSRGYNHYALRLCGKVYMYLNHRFTWECFNGMIEKELQINHIDHDKKNNHLDNLELVTGYENMQKGKAAGVLYGAASPNHPNYKY
jgi:hypothetical protein